MDKVLRKKFEINRKTRRGFRITILLFVLATLLIYQVLNNNVQNSVGADAEKNIENTSGRNADAIYRELTNRQLLLASIAESIHVEELTEESREEILNMLRSCVERYHYYNMGILTLDGTLYTTSGKRISVRDGSPYGETLDGVAHITESFSALDGGDLQLNAFTMPVRREEGTAFILTAAYRSMDLAEDLNLKVADGQGYSFILNPQGQAMIYPYMGEDEEYIRLINFIDGDRSLAPQGEERGSRAFALDGEEYYVHFERLRVNDWYLMTCAKTSDVYAGSRVIMRNVYIGMGFLWFMILAILGAMMRMHVGHQEKIYQVVFTDALLKEKNYDYLKLCLQQLPREDLDEMAMVVLDVDSFKVFNMIYGSRRGDDLIRYLDRVFKETLPEDRLYRHVSDQFVGILSCRSREEAEEKIRRLVDRMEADIAGKKVHPFVPSIGICMLKDYQDIYVAYSDAMIAKNTVKGSHMDMYAFYGEVMRRSIQNRMKLESAFQDALRNQEFRIFYQPKYDMRDGSIVGAEALVRWVRPDGTMISPGDFIPCFEESGQIIVLDEAVLDRVCREIRDMEALGLRVPRISVNLSRVHLKQPGIVEKIKKRLETMDIRPEMLSFEITESALYDDNISLSEIVSGLHALGLRVDMDDYGTGISSLNSLANVEFDVIKLDKSFIDRVGDPKMGSVIRSTIRLSEELGMEMIAEGVETEEQRDSLLRWGCRYAQGFYYARPMPKEDFQAMLPEI
ncbi:MAG: GGDEF domain-containing protein [Eubacteriales bacterium]|nr:GGDEF domain-containing protein [Eubacteriales bacterium]